MTSPVEDYERASDHADLRQQFAIALAASLVALPMNADDGGFAAVARSTFDLADALAAEDARRRRGEGL